MELSSTVSSGDSLPIQTGSSNSSGNIVVFPDPSVASYFSFLESESRAAVYLPNESYMRYLHAYWVSTGHSDYRITYDGNQYYLDAYTGADHDYYCMYRTSYNWEIASYSSFPDLNVVYGSGFDYAPVPQTYDRRDMAVFIPAVLLLTTIIAVVLLRRRL